jgi:hypothetical protein
MGLMVMSGKKVLAEGGFYVNPPFTDVEIKPDSEESSFELEIGNRSQTEAVFKMTVADFGSLDETGGVAFLTVSKDNNERKYALASWISLERDLVTVSPGKTEKIKVTILNKGSLTPGGHYGAVLATVKSASGVSSDAVGVNQSLATLIYVLKAGGEKPSLVFKSLEFGKNLFYFSKTVKLRFWNNGNVHVVPRGTVEVKNISGEIAAKGIINEGSVRVLPESFRVMELPMRKVKFWNWPGKYTIEVNFRYDGNEILTNVKTEIFYVGYEGTILILAGLGIIAILWRKIT